MKFCVVLSEFSTEDWIWVGGGAAVNIAMFIVLIAVSCQQKRKKRTPKTIQSTDHLYLPRELTIKWAVMALFIVFLQFLQLLTSIVVACLLWFPFYLDCTPPLDPEASEYSIIIQLISSDLHLLILKITVSAIWLFPQISLLRIIIFRRSILKFRAKRCFSVFIGIQLALIVVTGGLGFGNLNTLNKLNHPLCHLNLSRVPWIQGFFLVFFTAAVMEFLVLVFLRWNFRRAFHKKSLLEDSTQNSITEYTYSSCNTAQSEHSDIEYDLVVSPVPFILNSERGGIFELFNGCYDRWMAVRLLTRTPNTYDIYPQKLLIPPRRRLSSRITLHPSRMSSSNERSIKTLDNAILVEYYQLGTDTPFYSSNRPWTKPYLCSRNKWRYKIVLVFYEHDK